MEHRHSLAVVNPFEVRHGRIRGELRRSIENAKRDGILVAERDGGSQSAGRIQCAEPGKTMAFLVKDNPEPRVYSRASAIRAAAEREAFSSGEVCHVSP